MYGRVASLVYNLLRPSNAMELARACCHAAAAAAAVMLLLLLLLLLPSSTFPSSQPPVD